MEHNISGGQGYTLVIPKEFHNKKTQQVIGSENMSKYSKVVIIERVVKTQFMSIKSSFNYFFGPLQKGAMNLYQ